MSQREPRNGTRESQHETKNQERNPFGRAKRFAARRPRDGLRISSLTRSVCALSCGPFRAKLERPSHALLAHQMCFRCAGRCVAACEVRMIVLGSNAGNWILVLKPIDLWDRWLSFRS